MSQSPLSRGTPSDDILKFHLKDAYDKFQSPLSRGTPPDGTYCQTVSESVMAFQSPLSRGTPPDCIYIVIGESVMCGFNPL